MVLYLDDDWDKEEKRDREFPVTRIKNVVKAGGEDVRDFREKYRALKIESNRGKVTDTFYKGKTKFVKAEIP